jgi:hypothetical protein
MSTPPPNIITAELDDSGLSCAAFRVFCHLTRRGLGQAGAWGGIKGMADTIGCDRKTIIEALAELLETGWIIRTSRPGKTSFYTLGTQPEKRADPKNGPARKTDHHPARKTDHHPARKTGYEGVKGRNQAKEGISPAEESVDFASQIDSTTSSDASVPQKKERGAAAPVHDIPTALASLSPLLIALGRNPAHAISPGEEHELLPVLRSAAGLLPADIDTVSRAVAKRSEYTQFDDIPKDSPLRSVRRSLKAILGDWPNQVSIARQIRPARVQIETAPIVPIGPAGWEDAMTAHFGGPEWKTVYPAWHLVPLEDRRAVVQKLAA